MRLVVLMHCYAEVETGEVAKLANANRLSKVRGEINAI